MELFSQALIIVVVYVDDIIFGSDLKITGVNFASELKKEFEMSILGELTLFLGLQVSQSEKGILISQIQNVEKIQNGRIQTC